MAVIDTMYSDLIVSAVEVVPPKSSNGLRILGEKTKRDDSEKLKKSKENKLINNVRKLAVDAFLHLGARDFGRIDVKVDRSGQCYFMEANLVPGMTSGSSYFPKACEIDNEISYDDMIGLILDEGLRRVSVSLADEVSAEPLPLAM